MGFRTRLKGVIPYEHAQPMNNKSGTVHHMQSRVKSNGIQMMPLEYVGRLQKRVRGTRMRKRRSRRRSRMRMRIMTAAVKNQSNDGQHASEEETGQALNDRCKVHFFKHLLGFSLKPRIQAFKDDQYAACFQ